VTAQREREKEARECGGNGNNKNGDLLISSAVVGSDWLAVQNALPHKLRILGG
jgi:hypothetical protein